MHGVGFIGTFERQLNRGSAIAALSSVRTCAFIFTVAAIAVISGGCGKKTTSNPIYPPADTTQQASYFSKLYIAGSGFALTTDDRKRIVVVGETAVNQYPHMLICTSAGDSVLYQTYSDYHSFRDVVSSGATIAIAGSTEPVIGVQQDAAFFLLDTAGSVLSAQNVGVVGWTTLLQKVIRLKSGDYCAWGDVVRIGSPSAYNGMVSVFDVNGKMKWKKVVTEADNCWISSVVEKGDGNLAMTVTYRYTVQDGRSMAQTALYTMQPTDGSQLNRVIYQKSGRSYSGTAVILSGELWLWIFESYYQSGAWIEQGAIGKPSASGSLTTEYPVGTDDGNTLIPTSDGLMFLMSSGNSSDRFVQLTKRTFTGSMSWRKTLRPYTEVFAHDMIYDSNGDILLTGTVRDFSGYKLWLMKTDKDASR